MNRAKQQARGSILEKLCIIIALYGSPLGYSTTRFLVLVEISI